MNTFTPLRRLITDRLLEVLQAIFLGLGSWRDRERELFVVRAVDAVEAAQNALAAATAAHIAAEATLALGREVSPPGIARDEIVGLRGVDPRVVYGRPFVQLYTALSRGHEFPDALDDAVVRLSEIASLDLQQTHAHAARAAMEELPRKPVGWRRVLQGEKSCALCVVASTQRYWVEDLNPLHAYCDCTVKPVFDSSGQVIDEDLLERAHKAVEELTGSSDRGGRAPDYRKLILREHGELGTMLARPLDHFTTEGEI